MLQSPLAPMSTEPPQPELAEPKRFKRVCMSALALFIVYGNLAVGLHPRRIGLRSVPALPSNFALQDAFLIPGMFSGYTPFNFDPFIEGMRDGAGRTSDRGRFIELDVTDHFPLRAPITYVQFFAAHQWDMLGPSGQRATWALYAKQIKARHNRLHPEARISRLRFGVITFPQSPLGYRGAKNDGTTVRYLWYADP